MANTFNPYWDKKIRRWVLEYIIHDKDIGDYVQVIQTETLISMDRVIKAIRSNSK